MSARAAREIDKKDGGNMTVAELMRNNFDAIFIELNPGKGEAMMREAVPEDCVWIHPGGRLVGIRRSTRRHRRCGNAFRSTDYAGRYSADAHRGNLPLGR